MDVAADPLKLRLDFHQETVLLHDYTGAATITRVVSALDVAHTLSRQIDLTSSILPPDALWYAKTATGARVAIWRAPRVWNVRVRTDYKQPARKLRIPMPGLIFLCQQGWSAPYVFAAKARPREENEQLFHCPALNVFHNGQVCAGSHKFPLDPSKIPEDFFRSYFSLTADSRGRSKSHPNDLLDLWLSLDKQPTYPMEDLVPNLTVGDAMKVGR